MSAKAGEGVLRNVSSGKLIIGFLLCLVCSLAAKPVGKFSYKKAPENLAVAPFNGNVPVSDTMVAMAEYMHVLNQFYTDSIRDTPSVFFVIDHSRSMSSSGGGGGNNGNDRMGYRFTVSSAFIDTIAKKFPTADVGIGVFKAWLHYRAGDSPYFTAYPKSYDQEGAYLPLYKLNGTYSGQTGINILKGFLETKMVSSGGIQYAELVYSPSTPPRENTNINIGFEVAKKALLASSRPKACHYIIFLSDGEANYPTDGTAQDFQDGTDAPTTFTVYFTRNNTVPQSIRRMTENIRVNGYSLSNPRSQYWPFLVTDFDALMGFLMENVYSAIGASKPAQPKSITVAGSTVTNWNPADSTFNFGSLFPLIGQTTPFHLTIVYGKTNGDTTHTVDFNVQTQAGFTMPPADFEVKLWDRDIVFRHGGVPIASATEAMNQIELTFPWGGGTANYKYTNVTIELSTTVAPIDREIFTLAAGANVFTAGFTRVTSDMRTPGNGILEHALSGDAIVAVFRNSETPKLPLDTLRVTLPLNITPMAELDSAVTRDRDGDGYLDHIDLFFKKTIAIAHDAGSAFSVHYNGADFPVDSVQKLTESSYSLCLRQHGEPSPLETSWRPGITITALPGGSAVSNFPSLDGAAPVLWTVVKEIVNPLDHRTDIVTVTLSEKIFAKGHIKFTTGNQPARTFYAWIRQNGVFARIDAMFVGITNFTNIQNDSTLLFTMTNSQDLTNNNWVNIQAPTQPLCDERGNFPTELNRKVRVRVISPPVEITVFPNPSGPTAKHYQNGVFHFKHEPNAWNWVWKDNAGTVISLKNVVVPPSDVGKLKGYIKIYDVVGNAVNWASGEDIFAEITDLTNPVPEVNLYWSGLNKAGTAVAPGIYRVVVHLNYPESSEEKDRTLCTKAGIRPSLATK